MTFSISLLRVLRRTMGWNVFGESYASLFSLGIIIDVKCKDQKPRLIQLLAILIKFVIYLLSAARTLI